MIGRRGERGSGISVLAARHDDDELYCTLNLLQCDIFFLCYDNIQTDHNRLFFILLCNCSHVCGYDASLPA